MGALTDWRSVSLVFGAAVAVKTNNTRWTWGLGSFGKLGQNSTANLSSPVQVGALTNWASASAGTYFCAAIKTDGTLWSWGIGTNGRLGQNSAATCSSPIQVGALTDWSLVDTGPNTCLAIKTNGTLWSWGQNSNGQLGQNDTTFRSSPVQVGALTNWSRVSKSATPSMFGITTGNALFAWGGNTGGILGFNDTTRRSSPVQLGALTTWIFVSVASDNSTAAILSTSINPA